MNVMTQLAPEWEMMPVGRAIFKAMCRFMDAEETPSKLHRYYFHDLVALLEHEPEAFQEYLCKEDAERLRNQLIPFLSLYLLLCRNYGPQHFHFEPMDQRTAVNQLLQKLHDAMEQKGDYFLRSTQMAYQDSIC